MSHAGAKRAVSNPNPRLDLETALLLQKTELIGELAEATANQFNNTMMAVTSHAELELKHAAPPERRSLEQVLSNAARAAALVQKLLVLSRRHEESIQPVQLNSVITEINELLQALMGERIEVVVSLDPNVQRVNADRVELEQLILSLAMNARNAMAGGGSLALSTKLEQLEEESTRGDEEPIPARHVMLSVAGAGAGGEKAEAGSQSGSKQDSKVDLTWAGIQEVAKKTGGLLQISSGQGGALSFRVYFPALGAEVPKLRDPDASANISPAAKTILIVEDDDAVRVPATEFLKMEGFKVLQAKAGLEAIHVALRNRSSLDLLITDIMMPEMNGREVAEKLLEMHPHIKVLYMSGDAGKTATIEDAQGSQNVLQKPFRLNRLNDKIRDLLGG